MRKINEKNDQGPQVGWEDFDHYPMRALALFKCANTADPRERAFMKIYKQFILTSHNTCLGTLTPNFRIPYTESEVYSAEERSEQASSEAEINEERALRTLTKLGCESAPQLINCKREYQNDRELVLGASSSTW